MYKHTYIEVYIFATGIRNRVTKACAHGDNKRTRSCCRELEAANDSENYIFLLNENSIVIN